MMGLLGHPSFPTYPLNGSREPFPEIPRGEIILHSAGQDTIYASSGKKSAASLPRFQAVQFFPSGHTLQPNDTWFKRSPAPVDVEVDKLDDILLSSGG